MIYMEWQKDAILRGNAIPLSQKAKLSNADYEGLARRIGYKGQGITVNLDLINSQVDVAAPPEILVQPITPPSYIKGPGQPPPGPEGLGISGGAILYPNQGPTGPRGPAGPRGPQGDRGETGSGGAQGSRGETGSTGASGPTGASGTVGPRGPMGDTGPRGDSASFAMSLIDPPRYKPGVWPIQSDCGYGATSNGQTQSGASKPAFGKPALNGELPGGQIPYAIGKRFRK